MKEDDIDLIINGLKKFKTLNKDNVEIFNIKGYDRGHTGWLQLERILGRYLGSLISNIQPIEEEISHQRWCIKWF